MPEEKFTLFAVTAPGLESLAAAELLEMGVEGRVEAGGVAFAGDAATLYEANLRLRSASRVLLRVAEFRARAFYELERHAKRVAWERFVAPETPVALRVSSGRSKLYHERAIAQRVQDAIASRIGTSELAVETGDAEEDEVGGGQMFVVRFLRDVCTISADTSGELLHRRGYRQAVAKAPLRETLAAAMIRASGWEPAAPLLDPFCGSGTIPIEAALIARRIAPGLAAANRTPRGYAFVGWPEIDSGALEPIVDRLREEIRPAAPAPLVGSDRDAGAVEAALANAARAGVEGDVEIRQAALSAVDPPEAPGWLVCNPPYGLRVGESRPLRNLYAALGRLARERLPGWRITLLSADPRLEHQTGIGFEELLRTRNGGIPVRVVSGSA